MKRFGLFLAAAAASLLASCHINLIPQTDYSDPKTFDLASPSPLEGLPFIIEVDAFSNECSGRFKMVFREKGNQIEIDQYNRWAMTPGAMLTKYLAVCFAADSGNQEHAGKPVFVLDGSVLNWELDKTKKQVDMVVRYFIVEPGNSSFRITGTEDYSIPVDGTSAEAFADGMNKAAAKFAEHVVSALNRELRKRNDAAKEAPAAEK